MKVYVAAPFQNGPVVAEVHGRLERLGHAPTGRWVGEATGGADALHRLSMKRLSELCEINDQDVREADVLVALVAPGLGKEMFCEAALARLLGKPIVWVGREEWMPLSAFRPGCLRVETVSALSTLLGELSGDDGVERLMFALGRE